jgi:hypothetical protein
LLLEQVVAIGLIAMLLLLVAAMTLQTGRGSKAARLDYEARNIGRSLLEEYQKTAVDLLPVGTQPVVSGQLSNGLDYTATVELYSGGGTGVVETLLDSDIKGIRVTVRWKDINGNHQEQVEGALIRIAR